MDLLLGLPSLDGQLVQLEPLTEEHARDLAVAAEEDRAAFGFTWVPRGGEMEGYLQSQAWRGGVGDVRSVRPDPADRCTCRGMHRLLGAADAAGPGRAICR